jgi:heme exporter protein B
MGMAFLRDALWVAKKDLRIQFRERSLLLSMGLFALLVQVILSISFDAQQDAMKRIAPGILWLPILLSALLGFSRYGAVERDNGALNGLLLSPMDRGSLFLGKWLGNVFVVLCVALISVPAFFLFMKLPYPQSLILLTVTVILGSWGFTAMGVFLTTLAESSSISELLVPIMLFPLSVPLLIAIVRLTEIALFPSLGAGQFLWISLLLGYNLIFTLIPMLLFDLILEV